jgi:CBS domain-containing protein
MPALHESTVVKASIPRTATFLEAARVLAEQELAAIAVVDDKERVVGLFTYDDVLKGLFPGYLPELRHTAFLKGDADALAARLGKAGSDPVTKHMREPVTVSFDTSAAHVAERFLHCEWGALAVVENDRFVGMVSEPDFCRAILRRLTD